MPNVGRSTLILAIVPGNCLMQNFTCPGREVNEDHREQYLLQCLLVEHLSLCASLLCHVVSLGSFTLRVSKKQNSVQTVIPPLTPYFVFHKHLQQGTLPIGCKDTETYVSG